VSLNEVGGEPARFGVSPAEFHVWMMERQANWPLAMSTTSTHDTKRSEDVRARINVISEIPAAWGERVRRWAELNRDRKRLVDGEAMPDANDEYLLYQTLLGAWPLGEKEASDREGFVARVQAYMEKATREAKVHTSWISPADDYDAALRDFVAAVLEPEGAGEFLADFVPFQAKVARMGMLNALSQTALKLASPGVPDIYQGQEVWDFSLVDPDNRRPVDYAARVRMLDELVGAMEAPDRAGLAAELVEGWEDGRAKLYLTHLLLSYRKEKPELFREGEYVPLEARGPLAKHVVAFARRHGDDVVVVVVPRLWATLLWEEDARLPEAGLWSGTSLPVTESGLRGRYRNLLGGGAVIEADGFIALDEALASFPIALLERE
jgi:(1->4)-alpha-D-glucan 1-alpha-D-glucosylmutase